MSMPKVFAGHRRRRIGALVANGVAQAACGFGIAFALRTLLREAEQGRLELPWLAGMIGLGGAVLALRVREASDGERLGQDYVTRVRLRIFDRVAVRPARVEGERRFGVTLTRLTGDLNSLRNWVSLGIARSVVATASVVGLLGSLAHFSPIAALVVLGVVAAGVLAVALVAPALRRSVQEARKHRGRLANNLSEKVLAARAVWQLGRADHEKQRIRKQSEKLRDALVRRARWSALLRAAPEIAWPVAMVCVLASLVATARPMDELVVSVLLVGMIMTAMGQIARALDYRIAFEEGRRRIDAMLEEPRIREARKAVALPGAGPVALEFEDVVVAGVFDRVRLRAEAGERVLVIGPTGAGKSALLGLAARLVEPDGGEIRIDGIPVGRLELEALHAAVQLVSAELPLLRGTVLENVAYAAPEEDPEWIQRVAAACGLVGDAALAESGLETRVEERGANLPQGLRQRILLARAIVLRPRLLLIDEPGLLADPTSCAALEQALALVGATVVLVGTQWGTPLRVDSIWRLPEGVVEKPTGGASNVVTRIRWN
ncbi:MAG: ABC transporter ATP-binding protein [Myxococcota bacterium]